jgi:hypothetical protein
VVTSGQAIKVVCGSQVAGGFRLSGDPHLYLRGVGLQHLLQELDEAGPISPRAMPRAGQSSGWLERAQSPEAPPMAIVGGEGRSTPSAHPYLARRGLCTHRPQLIEAHDPPLRDPLRVGLDYGPLFWMKAASTCTWNQLCRRLQTEPSAVSYFQTVAGVAQPP